MRSGTEFSGFWGGIKVDFCVNWSRKRVSVTHLRKCPQHCMSLASPRRVGFLWKPPFQFSAMEGFAGLCPDFSELLLTNKKESQIEVNLSSIFIYLTKNKSLLFFFVR